MSVPRSRPTRRAVLAGITAGGVVACRPGIAPGSDGAPRPGAALSGTVQHVYWGGPVEGPLQYALDRFPERVPAGRVELVAVPNAQVLEKLQVMVAAGTPPDTAQINPRVITPLMSKGILADVTRYAKRDGKEFQQDDFFPAALERLIKDGKLHGAPVQMGLFVLIHNRDLFKASGVALPNDTWTWDTLAEAAGRLTRGEGDTKRFGITSPPWEILVWAYGGEILDKAEKVCLLTDPKAQAGLQWLKDLRHRHQAAPRPGEVTGLTNQQLFVAGRLAMNVVIPGFVNDMEKASPPFDWDLAFVPKGPARRATIVQGPSMAAIAQSKHLDLAWEWLKWFTGVEVRQFAAREDHAVGARKSGAAEYLKLPAPPANRRPLVDSANFARNQPYIAQYDEMTKVINAEWDAAIANNTKSIKEATESAKRQIDALLAGG
ncbi:MAG: sugar ABC transporter substrate-binding protein [Chloroflexi bacterium]|nr:sugar ABC transporter substrate-binding protein [Chloroflexota bacterium]